ncbi:lipopolysaccharide-assembly family protein [bacterium M00.F.Ca.ET.228.01.1.1]|uniref:LPS-assembly lipoprotein LptE n=1 Tax=Paraburkholderia phenoliruptrix TaxID=252970 RepID=UPI00109330AA|nr:lipopolysaccharide-assembly family protein [Paraburkholderia phenoliruptrix]MBW9133279.1 lipopolysaccharide-assembly family protein [Paraburkholderia ginsengiterrae]TGP44184.1 lipopolysaccharide-assembly family protein [bacterium M00.F.Ca.ET.228.01.1.1]TGS01847.1 lipopolysaccharide-assembly family protein [bacterium M00.F.Ca.ET.191.01.1.1]TGU08548.1 lipopolysaccharide-assembly family protein [bacterium M00.F.Ca.ET.155.01.1.1]
MTRRSLFVTLACSVLMLSACGFQLRGQQDYAFKRLFIAGGSPAASARLARIVEGGSDTVVVKSVANADATLQITEARGTSTLTLNSLGVVAEYQLNLNMNYTLVGKDGTVLIPPSVIALNRAMTYSDQYSQAKAAESDILFADMENDAIDQLTRRLSSVRSLHPAPGEQVPAVAPRAPLPPPPL